MSFQDRQLSGMSLQVPEEGKPFWGQLWQVLLAFILVLWSGGPGDMKKMVKGVQAMQSSFEVSKEGVVYILYLAFATLVLAILGWSFLALLGLLLTFFVLFFFRDPTRVVPAESGVVVSPADGEVVALDRDFDPVSGEKKIRIAVFMNLLSVHVNRCPVAGEVKAVKYIPGKFFNASLDKASKDNERNIITIEDGHGQTWTMVQIAGLVARRIVCWVRPSDVLARGARVGLIKFGSRVDLYLPEGYETKIALGEKVYAGQTVLAVEKGS